MREIKFRAKEIKTGKWVYGLPQQRSEVRGFANRNKAAEIGHIVSFEPHRMLESGANDYCLFWYEVDPETLGEYTGLKDKHGKEIFEGDILSYRGEYYIAKFGIDDDEICQWSGFYFEDKDATYRGLNTRLLVIAGNIHDNLDLLEKQP